MTLRQLFISKAFKFFTLALAVIFYILGVIIAYRPEQFLSFGLPGIFIFSVFGPGTIFLVPVAARFMPVFSLALVAALGMAVNDSISWLAGKNGDVVFKRGKRVERFERYIKKYGPWAMLVWSFIPFPYDFVAIISGYMGLPYAYFALPTFLGRFLRFLVLGSGAVAIFGTV